MNVMHVDTDPRAAARMLPDRHVNKMALESAQVLCTVADWRGVWREGLYRPTHRHHPCVRLAADNDAALHWLLEHGLALVEEHRWRRRSDDKHLRTEAMMRASAGLLGIAHGDSERWQGAPVALAMDDDLRSADPVQSYRAWIQRKLHLWHDAGRPARYTRRQPPAWLGAAPHVRVSP